MKKGISLPNKGSKANQTKRKWYQSITGSLIFSIVETQPDIAFATFIVSYFAKNLSRQHKKTVKTIMQYLKTTHTLGKTYGKDWKNLIIKSCSNSDWAGNHASRKSTLGFVFILNWGAVKGST